MKTFLEILFSFSALFTMFVIMMITEITGSKKTLFERLLIIGSLIFTLTILAYLLLYV